ncbi:MAG: hypothetical protein K2N56_04660 [Oscillospiraceae bacterium]|nr:hypothetical protein [Oscillospiraceae bacterium]
MFYAKINNLNTQEKFQKAVPLGGAEREARSGAERDWLGQGAALPGFEISFKSTAPRQHFKTSREQRYKTSQDQHFKGFFYKPKLPAIDRQGVPTRTARP